jgi:hypothetical protein
MYCFTSDFPTLRALGPNFVRLENFRSSLYLGARTVTTRPVRVGCRSEVRGGRAVGPSRGRFNSQLRGSSMKRLLFAMLAFGVLPRR